MVGLMKQYGYTQKELAAEVGVTEATMSRYINNSRTPKGTVIAAIAYKLHTSTDYLLGVWYYCGKESRRSIRRTYKTVKRCSTGKICTRFYEWLRGWEK